MSRSSGHWQGLPNYVGAEGCLCLASTRLSLENGVDSLQPRLFDDLGQLAVPDIVVWQPTDDEIEAFINNLK